MPSPSVPPPLRVREADGSPNVIPVFNLVISNGSVTKTGPTEVTIGMATGATGAPGASGGMAIGSGVTAGSAGAILFVDSNQQLAQSVANLFFNQASTRVGIGTSAPTTELHVIGSILATSVVIAAQATSAGHLVRADRTLGTLYPVLGSGNFTADRTVQVDTAFLVQSARTITAGLGLTGGGNLGADRTINLVTGGAGQYVITSNGAPQGISWIDTAGVGGGPVYAPTGGFYAVYAADANLSAEKVITAGSSIVIITDATAIYISALTNAAGGTIYAPTGGEYVTYIANGTLTAEKVLTAGTNVTITTDASAIYVNAETGASTTTVFFAPTGGEYITYVANNTLTAERILTAGTGIHIDSSVAATIYVTLRSDGTTGQMLIRSDGASGQVAWVATGGAGSSVIYAPTGGEYVTYVANNTLSAEKVLTAGSSITIVTDATSIYINAVTGGGGATTKTIRIPMALMTVQPNSANAFWMTETGANVDFAHVSFVDSGNGQAVYWTIVPTNVAASPNWSVEYYCASNTNAAADACVSLYGNALTHGEVIDSAYTLLSSAAALTHFISGTMNQLASSGGTYDGVRALSSNDYVQILVFRHGGSAVDTLSSRWDLYSVVLKVDVTG